MMERYICINQCVHWTKCYLYFPGQEHVFLSRAVIELEVRKDCFWHPFLLLEKASRMEELKEERSKSAPPLPSVLKKTEFFSVFCIWESGKTQEITFLNQPFGRRKEVMQIRNWKFVTCGCLTWKTHPLNFYTANLGLSRGIKGSRTSGCECLPGEALHSENFLISSENTKQTKKSELHGLY